MTAPPATITFYVTSCAATLKARTDITKIRHLLDAKKISYEEVRLLSWPLITCPVPHSSAPTRRSTFPWTRTAGRICSPAAAA